MLVRGWIAWAGEDPVAWIKKYAGRVTSLHIKDLAPKGQNADEDGQVSTAATTASTDALSGVIQAPGNPFN